jgi:hypothetical protein
MPKPAWMVCIKDIGEESLRDSVPLTFRNRLFAKVASK